MAITEAFAFQELDELTATVLLFLKRPSKAFLHADGQEEAPSVLATDP